MREYLIRDSLAALSFSLAILLISRLLLPPLLIFTPVPLIVLAYQKGLAQSLITNLILAVFVYFLADMGSAFLVIVLFSVLIIGINISLKENYDGFLSIFIISIVLLMVLSIIFMLFQKAEGISFFVAMENALREILNQELLRLKGTMATVDFIDFEYYFRELMETILKILPAIFFLANLLISLFNYYASISALRRRGYDIMERNRFNRLRLPRNIAFSALLTYIVIWLLRDILGPAAYIVLENLLVIIGSLFVLQGVSVLDYLLSKRFSMILRMALPIILFVMQFSPVFIILGFIESAFDLRNRLDNRTR